MLQRSGRGQPDIAAWPSVIIEAATAPDCAIAQEISRRYRSNFPAASSRAAKIPLMSASTGPAKEVAEIPLKFGPPMAKPPQIITLHVEINDITPAIWRRIEVDSDITLRGLHHIIQAAFGWTSSHLHEFLLEGHTYAMFDNDGVLDALEELEQEAFDDRKAKLLRLTYPGQKFTYEYDFGDCWMHTVSVERIESVAYKMGCANIIDGQRACPPEDVGGPHGYEEFLEVMQAKPRSQQAKDNLMWLGGPFTPDAFDKRVANSALLRMGWNGWGKK